MPLGEVRWLNNRESAPQIDKTAGMPASELLETSNRHITEVIPKYVVYSGKEKLEELVEYAKLRYGTHIPGTGIRNTVKSRICKLCILTDAEFFSVFQTQ